MTNQQKIKIQEYRAQGYGYGWIAKELGISVSTVSSFILRSKERIDKTGVCLNCGAKLKQTSGHRQKKYCSEECRRAWRRANPEKRKLKAYYKCICKSCGKEFISYGNKNRKYCSWDCYIKAKRGERHD